jgi:hypothetical protein
MKIISRQAAIAAGLDYYYTGKPCKRGHYLPRKVEGGYCLACKAVHRETSRTSRPLYETWRGMLRRCEDEESTSYERYGARGITVCDRWSDPIDGFDNFLADMGPRPEGFTLDRIDYDGNYEPLNCRWADWDTQQRNRRDTKIKGEDIPTIVGLKAEGLSHAKIAKIFNCGTSTVSGLFIKLRKHEHTAFRSTQAAAG